MKTLLCRFLPLAFLAFLPSASPAAVIQTPGFIRVEGILNGDGSSAGHLGDTLDYLKFEVLTTTSITITSGFGGNALLYLAQFIGRNDEFGFVGNPYYLTQESSTEWNFFTRTLEPGIYVTTMGVRRNTSYDIFDGFVPVNPEGGGFTIGEYAYSIAGDVRALEFWDGELDGTFKITRFEVPEPSGACLLAAGAIVIGGRRRRNGL